MPRFLLPILTVTVLCACASQPPAPVEDRSAADRRMMDEVRAPAGGNEQGMQVYALRNPAVAELSEAARAAEAEHDLARAAVLLERALRIEGRDPELLQHMAEVKLGQGQYDQAAGYASRSFDQGPRLGELCERNWRTLAAARQAMGEDDAARRARQRLDECRVEPPERF